MAHSVFRGISMSDRKTKSIHSTDDVVSIGSHVAIGCLGQEGPDCNSIVAVNSSLGLIHHYRWFHKTAVENLNLLFPKYMLTFFIFRDSCKHRFSDCEDIEQRVEFDDSVHKYLSAVAPRIVQVLDELDIKKS